LKPAAALAAALALAASAALGGCVTGERLPFTASVAVASFDPIAWFTGATEGSGRLHKVFSKPRAVRVAGFGAVTPDGTLVLGQSVEIAGSAPRTRQWRLRRVAPGRYTGTLSDAVGPVAVTGEGPRLTVRYAMGGGLVVEQVLTLAAGGREVRNVMKVRKLGIVVARLDELIRRV
jgi:hypothetical protein